MKNPKAVIDCCFITLTIYIAIPIIGLLFPNNLYLSTSLLLIFPIACLCCGIYCGLKSGFQLYYSLFAALLFLPSMYFFYDMSIWPMLVLYFSAATISCAVGYFVAKKRSGRRSNGRLK
ncbi:hypothetical protein [uncultured Negativibacillus sp.]|uniref:hypothetical protein n=1 Tax=uncultured Negativibacillus sp. TaxID=1980696 RepID=UPI0025D3C684|nr:hypothetical protein [uncultured Negativibacillus sp.]